MSELQSHLTSLKQDQKNHLVFMNQTIEGHNKLKKQLKDIRTSIYEGNFYFILNLFLKIIIYILFIIYYFCNFITLIFTIK